MARVCIIIPCLQPDEKFLKLLQNLRQGQSAPFTILVVDDGSGEAYAPVFERAKTEYGCTVLTHAVNLGKGRALKTAFNYMLTVLPGCSGAVTVDADGQHAVEDVFACVQALGQAPKSLVLGSRNFDGRGIPFHNRAGNKITRMALKFATGISVRDTQTGLRGIPAHFMKALMNVPGERFEFEMNMLLETKEAGVEILQIPMRAIYIEQNRTSHFRPLKDSIKIYRTFFKYILFSLSSFVIDISLFALFAALLKPASPAYYIAGATVLARVSSSLFNFLCNQRFVFGQNKGRYAIVKYYLLAAVQVALSSLLVTLATNAAGGAEVPIKTIVDVLLFFISFYVQRSWVFAAEKTANRP